MSECPKYQNREWLYLQYWILEKSSLEIAKICSCTKRTIFYWMEKFEIPTRNMSEAQKISKCRPNYKGYLNPMYGNHHSEETKRKISKATKGKNNPMYGKKHTKETRRKISKKLKGKHPSKETRIKLSNIFKGRHKDDKNPNWKGNEVLPHSVHEWIRKNKPKPKLCEICGLKKPQELSNIDHKYRRNIKDYRWVCIKCHRQYDNNTFESYKNPWNKGLPKELQPMFGKKHSAISKRKMAKTKRGMKT